MKLPQLSLRELFLLVVIAALGCALWLERVKLAELRKREQEVAAQQVANEVNARIVEQVLAELWTLRGKHADIDQALDDFQASNRTLMMP